MKKFLKRITISGILLFIGLSINTQVHASMFGNKEFKIMEINEEFKLIKP